MDLQRFVKAQESCYSDALDEIRRGQKTSHWMWFIFPQVKGLGRSYMADYYGIESEEEAKAYYNHPVLGQRLTEICTVLLNLPDGLTAREIFGYTDAMKLRSSMTLFYIVSNDVPFFQPTNLPKYQDFC